MGDRLQVTAIQIEDAAKVLTRLGGRLVEPSAIQEHVAAGAPENEDGTINLVFYAAWLLQKGKR